MYALLPVISQKHAVITHYVIMQIVNIDVNFKRGTHYAMYSKSKEDVICIRLKENYLIAQT